MSDAATGTHVPDVIARYHEAHDRQDTDKALSAFAPDATVVDEDRAFRGVDAIHQWLESAGREYTYTRTFVGAQHLDDDTWVIHNRLEGNFPGGVAELHYRYRIANGLIAELVIAP